MRNVSPGGHEVDFKGLVDSRGSSSAMSHTSRQSTRGSNYDYHRRQENVNRIYLLLNKEKVAVDKGVL